MLPTNARRAPAVCALATLAVILLCSTPSEAGAPVRARVDSPVVISGEVFPAGELRISEVSGALNAIELDGRRIALLHAPADREDGSASLRFRRDGEGRLHLLAVSVTTARGYRTLPLRVASVVAGMETVAPASESSVARAPAPTR
jgi:hypothetical protein